MSALLRVLIFSALSLSFRSVPGRSPALKMFSRREMQIGVAPRILTGCQVTGRCLLVARETQTLRRLFFYLEEGCVHASHSTLMHTAHTKTQLRTPTHTYTHTCTHLNHSSSTFKHTHTHTCMRTNTPTLWRSLHYCVQLAAEHDTDKPTAPRGLRPLVTFRK